MPARTYTPQVEKASQFLLEYMALESQVDLKTLFLESKTEADFFSSQRFTTNEFYQVVGYSEEDSIMEDKLMLKLVRVIVKSKTPRLVVGNTVCLVADIQNFNIITKEKLFDTRIDFDTRTLFDIPYEKEEISDTSLCKKARTKATFNGLHKSYNNKINTKFNSLKKRW